MTNKAKRKAQAEKTVLKFTAAATATGAIPVPAVSAAIVAENAAMVAVIASDVGMEVTVEKVAASLGAMGTVNVIGRAVFMEAARAIGWAAGPLGIAGVSVLGAFTAGLQTYLVGQLAIAIAENNAEVLSTKQAKLTAARAKTRFEQEVWSKVRPEA